MLIDELEKKAKSWLIPDSDKETILNLIALAKAAKAVRGCPPKKGIAFYPEVEEFDRALREIYTDAR